MSRTRLVKSCPTDRDGLLLAAGHRTLICLAGRSPSYDLALLAPRVFGLAASEISAGPERDEPPGAVALVSPRVFWGILADAVIDCWG